MTALTCTDTAPSGSHARSTWEYAGWVRSGHNGTRHADLAEREPGPLTNMENTHVPPSLNASQTPPQIGMEATGDTLMTWTRLDDGWTDRPAFDDMPYDARWHYLCLVQFCSRTSRYDGVIRAADARRCSDVPDPATANAVLGAAGLVVVEDDGTLRLPFIGEHVPPPYLRDENRKERQRTEKRRSRLHAKGEHTECLPDRCAKAVSVESEAGSSPSRPVLSRPGVSTDRTADTATERAHERWASGYDD